MGVTTFATLCLRIAPAGVNSVSLLPSRSCALRYRNLFFASGPYQTAPRSSHLSALFASIPPLLGNSFAPIIIQNGSVQGCIPLPCRAVYLLRLRRGSSGCQGIRLCQQH